MSRFRNIIYSIIWIIGSLTIIVGTSYYVHLFTVMYVPSIDETREWIPTLISIIVVGVLVLTYLFRTKRRIIGGIVLVLWLIYMWPLWRTLVLYGGFF